MAKEQRINFTLRKTPDGMMSINMSLYPKMAKNEKQFRKLPVEMQEMQSSAASIGKFVMEAMMKLEKEKQEGGEVSE